MYPFYPTDKLSSSSIQEVVETYKKRLLVIQNIRKGV